MIGHRLARRLGALVVDDLIIPFETPRPNAICTGVLICAWKTKRAVAHPCSQQVRAMWDDYVFMQRSVGNVCCQDFADLDLVLRRAKARLRHTRHVLQGSITECGCQA